MSAALLTRIDTDQNMRRFYRVNVMPDLFGGMQVVREWGRIGTRGQSLTLWCATTDEARALALTFLALKRRRGYVAAD